jgi:hypothetical protein
LHCDSLLDDDISDDVRCAQKVIAKLGMNAWRIEKTQGCLKELINFDDNCPNKGSGSSSSSHLHRDYCEYAIKLFATYDISNRDALTWSCIAEHHRDTHASTATSKTGNVNLKLAEDRDQEDAACIDNHDVECSIKIQKKRRSSASGFERWSEYGEFCENISGSKIEKCFGAVSSVIVTSESEKTKLTAFGFGSTETPRQFTTSTDVSVLEEHEHVDIVTPIEQQQQQQTTEYLTRTLEKPTSEEDDMTIEGYSQVRLMFSDKNLLETSDDLKTTSEKFDDMLLHLLLNSSAPTPVTDAPTHNTDAPTLTTDATTHAFDMSLKCDITRSFADSGLIDRDMIAKFVCIAEHETGLNASVIKQSGEKLKFGLFQIDSSEYCNTNEKINKCDVLCTLLTDTQYDNDLECAKLIYDKVGFDYWPSYSRHCEEVSSSEQLLKSCQVTHTTTHRPYTVLNYELLKQKFNLTDELTTATMATSTTATAEHGAIKIEGEMRLCCVCARSFSHLHLRWHFNNRDRLKTSI